MKISVIGHSGAGKSTLAGEIGKILKVPVLYLDKVQFLPNWQVRDPNKSAEYVKDFLEKHNDWVIDGNYSSFCYEERMARSDVILFMDFSSWRCLARAIKRYWHYRGKTRESMAEGCCEKLDLAFIWWILHEGRNKKARARYNSVLSQYKDKSIVLKNPKSVRQWIEDFAQKNKEIKY